MELLQSVGKSTDESEFYTPYPAGYKKDKTKFVVVFGTVISGLGKGIFSSSLAKLLKDKGLKVSPIKLEGYLNIDSGTLNPFRHGEVFVLDDGMETDMDLGTYERVLDQNLGRKNFATSGQIYSTILNKERAGDYLGRDVQMIPHVTGEVKLRLRELAMNTDADVVFVEVGGTVGDIENSFYIEALRELSYEEGPGQVCFACLCYILAPPALGEQKSKAAQLGIKRLMEYGIHPDVIACRAEDEVGLKVREKISLFTNVPVECVFSMHDLSSIYLLPENMRAEGLDDQVVEQLGLKDRCDAVEEEKHRIAWQAYVEKIQAEKPTVRIGVTGKYVSLRDSYASIIKAIEHSGIANEVEVEIVWIETTDVNEENVDEILGGVDGIIVPGGFGKRGTEGKILCIEHARKTGLPYLGICLGFQMAVIEFARNVCGLADATSTELDPETTHPVISILPDQKLIEGLGGNMRLGGQDVQITPGTIAYDLYGQKEQIRQRFRHRYEVDPSYIEQFEAAGLVFSGRHPEHPIMQVLELPKKMHPYFVAAQYHPELTSRPLNPQPMFVGLIEAAKTRAGK
ncbi:MAG: CTP synthase [Phycisphaerales bacterium]|nr:CTP synthase [Phycisphaerales bacterium]